uniref:tetratricopeptide repeat protein n=1 Tax=Prevotella sp. TaxID=59823 RepID=UPI00402711F2
MKTITVFLASSNELNYDRNSFQALIAKLDDIYEPRGIRIKCRRWEDFPAYCTGERTQDVYNQTVRSCDMCICMFHKEAGQYTIEEFEQALDEYRTNHSHPKTFVYIRALVEGEVETDELKAFKDQLFKSIGHYWCNYACDDAMNLHFVMQLERLMPDMGLAAGDSSQLQVEEGKVTLQGVKIADYTNLPFAAANHEYCSLKEKYAQLDKDITQLRALGIDDTHDLLREKVIDRQKCHEQMMNMEKQLLDMALLVNKTISSHSPMSERKRLAIEMFEQGNIKGVISVLNEEDMASEAKQAELEIARGRQLVQSGNDLIEKGIQTIQAQVEDYILRAKALMLDFDNSDRFSLACNAYERAVELTRNHLSQAELADRLNDYYCFLYDNNQFSKCEAYIEECVSIRAELCRDHPETYEPYLADSYNNLALLYSDTQRFQESESMHKSALVIRERFAKANPQAYEPDLADSYNNLAVLYKDTQRFEESESMYKSALAIHERLAKANPQAYEPDLADSYNNLALLYSHTQRFHESEAMYKSALAIRERLAKASPQAYEPALANSYNNLALLYSDTQLFEESESMYKSAIAIRERLAKANPQAYEADLANSYNNLANLYSLSQSHNEKQTIPE